MFVYILVSNLQGAPAMGLGFELVPFQAIMCVGIMTAFRLFWTSDCPGQIEHKGLSHVHLPPSILNHVLILRNYRRSVIQEKKLHIPPTDAGLLLQLAQSGHETEVLVFRNTAIICLCFGAAEMIEQLLQAIIVFILLLAMTLSKVPSFILPTTIVSVTLHLPKEQYRASLLKKFGRLSSSPRRMWRNVLLTFAGGTTASYRFIGEMN